VDNEPVDLPSATCDRATPANCESPLPPLTEGIHTIAVVNVIVATGVESGSTQTITVEKLPDSATVAGAAKAGIAAGASVTLGDVSYDVQVVARDVRAPAQLAPLPDGRLLVAEATGRVRMVRPAEPGRDAAALDAAALFAPAPLGSIGVTRHPGFLENRFVYVSFVSRDRAGRAALRVSRLREVGNTLGEPLPIFEAPVTFDTSSADGQGPRMAFGPDGLLYVLLPPGAAFDRDPAASAPVASMVRLTDDGRVPAIGPVTGVDSSPLGFTWQPSSDALWVLVAGQDGEPVLRSLGGDAATAAASPSRSGLRTVAREGRADVGLLAQGSGSTALALVRTLVASTARGWERPLRLAVPVLAGASLPLAFNQMSDAVVDRNGTVFLAADDAVLRLTPRERQRP
jgi:hypothetical protein